MPTSHNCAAIFFLINNNKVTNVDKHTKYTYDNEHTSATGDKNDTNANNSIFAQQQLIFLSFGSRVVFSQPKYIFIVQNKLEELLQKRRMTICPMPSAQYSTQLG